MSCCSKFIFYIGISVISVAPARPYNEVHGVACFVCCGALVVSIVATNFVLVKISSIKARKIEADLLLVVVMLFVGYRTEQPEPQPKQFCMAGAGAKNFYTVEPKP